MADCDAVLIVLSDYSRQAKLPFLFAAPGSSFFSNRKGAQRTAATMQQPDRLLSAVLFWNLVINMIYFTISARVGMQLENHEDGSGWGVLFAVGSVAIFFSGMFPKSFAVCEVAVTQVGRQPCLAVRCVILYFVLRYQFGP